MGARLLDRSSVHTRRGATTGGGGRTSTGRLAGTASTARTAHTRPITHPGPSARLGNPRAGAAQTTRPRSPCPRTNPPGWFAAYVFAASDGLVEPRRGNSLQNSQEIRVCTGDSCEQKPRRPRCPRPAAAHRSRRSWRSVRKPLLYSNISCRYPSAGSKRTHHSANPSFIPSTRSPLASTPQGTPDRLGHH